MEDADVQQQVAALHMSCSRGLEEVSAAETEVRSDCPAPATGDIA